MMYYKSTTPLKFDEKVTTLEFPRHNEEFGGKSAHAHRVLSGLGIEVAEGKGLFMVYTLLDPLNYAEYRPFDIVQVDLAQVTDPLGLGRPEKVVARRFASTSIVKGLDKSNLKKAKVRLRQHWSGNTCAPSSVAKTVWRYPAAVYKRINDEAVHVIHETGVKVDTVLDGMGFHAWVEGTTSDLASL